MFYIFEFSLNANINMISNVNIYLASKFELLGFYKHFLVEAPSV